MAYFEYTMSVQNFKICYPNSLGWHILRTIERPKLVENVKVRYYSVLETCKIQSIDNYLKNSKASYCKHKCIFQIP